MRHADSFATLPALALALVWGAAGVALGPRSARAEDEPDPKRFVVLNPPGGGGAHLREEISKIDKFTLKGQKWFLEQVDQRALDAKGLMNRPEDLTWLMDKARIAYVLYAVPEEHRYEVRLVSDDSGEVVFKTVVDRPKGKLTRPGARLVRYEVVSHLGLRDAPDDQQKAATDQSTADQQGPSPEELKKRAARSNRKTAQLAKRNWLWASAKFRLFKRDLTFAGTRSQRKGVLTYRSFFYPGFELTAEAYPLGISNPDAASTGFFFEFDQGFDGGTLPVGDGETKKVSIKHTSFQVGPIFRLGDIFEKPTDELRRRIRFGTFLRYEVYATPSEVTLPTLSLTSLVAGGMITQPVLDENFAIEGRLNIAPVAFFGKGSDRFGQTSGTLGFGSRLGVLYAIKEAYRVTLGYRFRLNHSRFTGRGRNDFAGSEGFELVQGLDLGLQYSY
ncbi:MAG: hypothetical protein ABEL76_09905 [Bradymonadaceae bacterium]